MKPPKWVKWNHQNETTETSKTTETSQIISKYMKKWKKNSLDLWYVTMAAWSCTQIHMCDIITSQTWKMNERKGVDHDHKDIEKKVSTFHIFNGILARTRNVISKKGFLVVSWILRRWRIDNIEPRMYGNTISRVSVKLSA